MAKFTRRFLLLAIVVVVLLAALGVWAGIKFFSGLDPASPSPYSAVFLSTGDVYYGKLSWFPWPKLREVWFLQRGLDPKSQEVQFGIVPFRTAFWGPMDEIKLNPEQIVFVARLRNDSQVAKAFANPGAFAQPVLPENGGSVSGEFRGPSGPPPSGGR